MRKKDDILLEQAYSKVLNEEQQNVLGGTINLNGDVIPAENSIESFRTKLEFNEDPDDPKSILSKQFFEVDGKRTQLKIEEDGSTDDRWYHYSFIDPTTKEHVATMNWGRGEFTHQDVLDYIELGLPSGVLRKSEKSPYPTRFNLDSNTLNKFMSGEAKKEGLELIPRGK